MTTKPVEAVIFDFGGVISVPVFHNLDPIDDEFGVPRGSLHQLIFGAENGAVPEFHRLETGEITLTDYLAGLERRAPNVLGRPLDGDAFLRFSADRGLQVQWPVVHRIRGLRADGVRLALLTNNAKEFGDSWKASFPVDELFPVVVDSSDVGLRKPDPRIYELTCERVGVEPTAALFLDDNVDNVAASRALGIESILVTPDPLVTLSALDEVLHRRGVSLP
ncbi:MAG: HAD family phosphatase [Acidimicrobiia bacterium]|nr:HAD family phosphatase [Acidimicrobiia bacterium]